MADDSQPAETSTSRSLLMQLKNGQPAAWERLTALYAPLVYRWCREMRLAEQDMPDVFQQVFQSVASHIDTSQVDQPTRAKPIEPDRLNNTLTSNTPAALGGV